MQGLLRNTGGDTALLRATWLYPDGTEGTASAQVDVVSYSGGCPPCRPYDEYGQRLANMIWEIKNG